MRVVPPGGGEVVGDSPDRRVEILCDDDAAHVTWSRVGPGRDGADLIAGSGRYMAVRWPG